MHEPAAVRHLLNCGDNGYDLERRLSSFVCCRIGDLDCRARLLDTGGAQDGRRRKVLIQSLLMVLPLVVVLGYFVVMHDHAIVHIPVFGCKNWAIVFAILFVSGVSALRGLRSQKVA